MSEEKRRTPRAETHIPIEVRLSDGHWVEGVLVDASLRGMLIRCEEPLTGETQLEIKVHLAHLEERIVVRARGEVVRRAEEGAALELVEIDIASFSHLRRLIDLNLYRDDGEDSQREAV